jgi:hypothetical protein
MKSDFLRYTKKGTSHASILLMMLFACCIFAMAQDATRESSTNTTPSNVPEEKSIVAEPNRPTFSTTAESVGVGVFEIEYGFEAAKGHQNVNSLLKFGLTMNLELRFANNPFDRETGTSALGDSAVGFKYRFLRGKRSLPTFSLLYMATLPTAGTSIGVDGLGHDVGILISKDFGSHHLDFNEIAEWRSRSQANGFDRDYFAALAYSHALRKKLGITAELSGYSRVNSDTPPTFVILQGLTYNISSRLVLDGGCYFAARGDLPRVTFFAGVTYSVADLYGFLHARHHQP